MEKEIINRVANSGLITLDLADYLKDFRPKAIDMKDLLHEEIMLREKPFRAYIKNHDWSAYKDHWVAVYSSVDAIIPSWSYMLISSALQNHTDNIVFGDQSKLRETYMLSTISAIDEDLYKDQRVIIKGCADVEIPNSAYVAITIKLQPVVKSLMYGEACSAVPVYKNKS